MGDKWKRGRGNGFERPESKGGTGRVKSRQPTGPGAITKDMSQVAIAFQHSPVEIVTHPSKDTPMTQTQSEIKLPA